MDDTNASSSKAAPARLTPRVRKLLIFLALIGTTVVVWLCLREPGYQGKSASYWLEHAEDETSTQAAVTAFRVMGKPGILFLAKTIEANPFLRVSSPFDRLAESRLPMPTFLRKALHSQSAPINRRGNALRILQSLGPDAEAALPSLMREYNAMVNAGEIWPDQDIIEALGAVGDRKAKYIPDFIKALRNRREATAWVGAYLLGSIGPKAKAAVPVLLEQMPAGSWRLSNAVAEALWKIDRQTNLVLAAFTNELLTVPESLQGVPLGNLCEMGPAARPALPLLLQMLTNSNEWVRTGAVQALSKIDPGLFKSTIAEINQNPTATVERLLRVIQKSDSDHENRLEYVQALRALALFGHEARPAVPALIEILERARPEGVTPGAELEAAVNVLAEIGPEARSAVPALVALLTVRRFYNEPSEICRALGNIGPGAASAVPALEEILQGGDPWLQIAAATALVRIVPEEKSYLAPILMTLTNSSNYDFGKDPRFSWPAKVALWRLGLEKEPPIAEMMPPRHSWPIWVALPLLGDIGPAAKPALPYLEHIVDSDPEIAFRRMAAIAIRKIDSQEAAKLQLPGILVPP
jgi:HEAT repeat protein